MERESEGKISYDHTIDAIDAIELLIVLRTHWQVKAEVSGRQLPESILAQK